MKPVLCIHEVTPAILGIPKETLEQYVLTFDDGLYSQYLHWELFSDIPTTKIFFISPAQLTEGLRPQIPNITSSLAHANFFGEGDTSAFMTKKQVQKLKLHGAIIGGHSFQHYREQNLVTDVKGPITLEAKFRFLKEDTQKMLDWFAKELHMPEIEHFCFPYNNEYKGLYPSIIKGLFNIRNVYGQERISVEALL